MTFENKDIYIEEHMPFIIKTVADFTKRYVEIENSEELCIAIEAFSIAMDQYNEQIGGFFPFAKRVIVNKLIDEIRKKPKIISIPLESADLGSYDNVETNVINKSEIERYEHILVDFGLSFERLTKVAPKHKITRINIIQLSKKISENETLTNRIINDRKIPITEISKQMSVSLKIVKSHKEMITAIFLAYHHNISLVVKWLDSI